MVTFYRLSKNFFHSDHMLQALQNFHSFCSHSTGSPKLSLLLLTFYRLPKTFIPSAHFLQAPQNFHSFCSHSTGSPHVSSNIRCQIDGFANWLKSWLIFFFFHPPVTYSVLVSYIVITLHFQALSISGHTSTNSHQYVQ